MKSLKIYYTHNTWNFPRKVAHDRGYFEDEGLDVELVEKPTSCTEDEDITARKNLDLFQKDELDVYSACEWGTIKRTWAISKGNIFAHRPPSSNVPYTIFTRPETGIEGVEDLANVPVGIKEHSGSHYSTIEALEEHLPREEVEVVHSGRPIKRLRALVKGELDAATLMGPEIAVAESLGLVKVTSFRHGGAFVGPDELDRETMEKFIRAVNRAIEDINRNPGEFKDHFLDMAESELEQFEEEFDVDWSDLRERIEVPRYDGKIVLTDEKEVENKLTWMQDHELLDSSAVTSRIVP